MDMADLEMIATGWVRVLLADVLSYPWSSP